MGVAGGAGQQRDLGFGRAQASSPLVPRTRRSLPVSKRQQPGARAAVLQLFCAPRLHPLRRSRRPLPRSLCARSHTPCPPPPPPDRCWWTATRSATMAATAASWTTPLSSSSATAASTPRTTTRTRWVGGWVGCPRSFCRGRAAGRRRACACTQNLCTCRCRCRTAAAAFPESAVAPRCCRVHGSCQPAPTTTCPAVRRPRRGLARTTSWAATWSQSTTTQVGLQGSGRRCVPLCYRSSISGQHQLSCSALDPPADVPPNEEHALEKAVANQPVSVAIEADQVGRQGSGGGD